MNLPRPLHIAFTRATRPLQAQFARLVYPPGTGPDDFRGPPGEPALTAPGSVTWRVCANPLAMLVGGIAAVVLELAEPRVRTGVWEHTRFRDEPIARLRRTGHAAMMTAFGARSRTEALVAHVNRAHARVAGVTPDGVPYRADDDALLTWVHATAGFGFLQAYQRCVRPLPVAARDAYYAENRPAARLYGVASPPADEAALARLFEAMRPRLAPSPIVHEFLAIMARVPLLPAPARPLQRLLVRAAVQCVPAWARERLALDGPEWAVPRWQWRLLRALGRAADHLDHPDLPAVVARGRVGA